MDCCGYRIEIPTGLVTNPETDIVVTPKFIPDFTANNCDCEFGTAATGKSCHYYGQSIRNNKCESCDDTFVLENGVCI